MRADPPTNKVIPPQETPPEGSPKLPYEILPGIPAEMRALRQWVCWRKVERDGKTTKQPINPHTGMLASVDDPSTWSTFEETSEAWQRLGCDGVGFVFTDHDPYFGLDFDGCDRKTFLEMSKRFLAGYAELSQSGLGYHIIGRASLPISDPQRTGRTTTHVPGMKKLEIYRHGRFFVMTGLAITAVTEIGDCQAGIDWLFQKYLPVTIASTAATFGGIPALTDDQIIELMKKRYGKKFLQLWAGDTSHPDYGGDDSKADCGLAWMIAFYTRDPAQIRRIMKQSGLIRAKWELRCTSYRRRNDCRWSPWRHGAALCSSRHV